MDILKELKNTDFPHIVDYERATLLYFDWPVGKSTISNEQGNEFSDLLNSRMVKNLVSQVLWLIAGGCLENCVEKDSEAILSSADKSNPLTIGEERGMVMCDSSVASLT